MPIETSLEDLVQFVAQSSAEREELEVVSAELRVPAEILRLGFHFVDTPGTGSAVAANAATTRAFLPEADAVIFVTGFDAPLSESEVDFLADVRRHVHKLFFVVNKRDLVSRSEADEVLRFVRERVTGQSDDGELRVFAVSARDALDARAIGSGEKLNSSGPHELEHALVAFLTGEKAREFLWAASSRTERFLARLRRDLELGHRAQGQGPAEHLKRIRVFDDRVAALLTKERQVVDRLREHVAALLPSALAERSVAWTDELRSIAIAELDARWPSPQVGDHARGWMRDAAGSLQDPALRLFEQRLRRWLSEARSLLVSLVPRELAELDLMSSTVERLAAEIFDAREPDGLDSTWSAADLPPLAIEPVVFTLEVEVPHRRRALAGSKLESEGRKRLTEGIDAGVVAYANDLRRAIERAAQHWIDHLVATIERETRDAANRVRAHADNPHRGEQLAVIADLEQRLNDFRGELVGWEPAGAQVPDEEPASQHPTPASGIARRCVISQRVARVPFEYMARAQWELVQRDQRRAEHARGGGFCAMHTWQYAEMASDTGIAVAYAPLAQSVAALISAVENGEQTTERLRASLAAFMPGPDRCPACIALGEAVRGLVDGLAQQAADGAAPSLCLPHIAAVLGTDAGRARARWLADKLAGTLGRASEDMQTYSLKRESLRGQLLNEEEEAACQQVISYLAGQRALARPLRSPDELG